MGPSLPLQAQVGLTEPFNVTPVVIASRLRRMLGPSGVSRPAWLSEQTHQQPVFHLDTQLNLAGGAHQHEFRRTDAALLIVPQALVERLRAELTRQAIALA